MNEHSEGDFFDAIDAFLQSPRVDRATLLQRAWADSTGNPGLDELRRHSMAAQAGEERELAATLLDLKWSGRSHLALHIHGEREDRHETSARVLGQFLSRASMAVKEVTKSLYGLARLDGDLSVLAPARGSVEVVFVEQEPPRDQDIGGTRADAWADGLKRVTLMLNMAEGDQASLDASMQDLRVPARRALRLLAKTVEDSSWSLEGTLTDRDGLERAVRLGTSAAARLAEAASREPTGTYPTRLEGVVDGWRWSSHTMRLLPTHGAAIEAFVPDEFASMIARLNTTPWRRLSADFEVTEVAREKSIKRTYQLVAVAELPDLFDSAN